MTLASCDTPLFDAHDVIMLDLDGVVYRGGDAVPSAVESLTAAQAAGAHLAYLTNNASRPPEVVAEHLRELGLQHVELADVVTSAQAIAGVMAHDLPEGALVLVIGGEGLKLALSAVGLHTTDTLDDTPVAVVQGYAASVGWRQLAEASYAIESGLPWYVSNTDLTIPTARGVAPGNGTMVRAVATATGVEPKAIAGKPYAPLFDETLRRLEPREPLMVGDRLDTDIEGAVRAGITSLAVLTGVSTIQEIADAEALMRPSYVAADLSSLSVPHPPVQVGPDWAECGQARVALAAGTIRADAESGTQDPLHQLRAAIALAWSIVDSSGENVRLDATIAP